MSKLNKQNIDLKELTKLCVNLLQKLLKYRILFKDILTFLRLNYRDALLKILYLIVIGIGINNPKIRSIG